MVGLLPHGSHNADASASVLHFLFCFILYMLFPSCGQRAKEFGPLPSWCMRSGEGQFNAMKPREKPYTQTEPVSRQHFFRELSRKTNVFLFPWNCSVFAYPTSRRLNLLVFIHCCHGKVEVPVQEKRVVLSMNWVIGSWKQTYLQPRCAEFEHHWWTSMLMRTQPRTTKWSRYELKTFLAQYGTRQLCLSHSDACTGANCYVR